MCRLAWNLGVFLLEPSGSVQARNGTALPLPLFFLFLFSILCFCVFLLFIYFSCIFSTFMLSLSYFCTGLPTTATGWNPNCSKLIKIKYKISLSASLFHWFGIRQKECRIFQNLTTGHRVPIILTSDKPLQIARGVFVLSNLLVTLMTKKKPHLRYVPYSTVQKVGLLVRIQLPVS